MKRTFAMVRPEWNAITRPPEYVLVGLRGRQVDAFRSPGVFCVWLQAAELHHCQNLQQLVRAVPKLQVPPAFAALISPL